MLGHIKQSFWPKIDICTQRKPLYFVNSMNVSSLKFGHDLKNKVVQKLKLEKDVLKKNNIDILKYKKNPWIFDVENLL